MRQLGIGVGIALALLVAPTRSLSQEAAVSADVVVRLFEAGLSGNGVMNELRGRCLDFRVDDAPVQARLRQAGADDAFLQQLRGLCYTAPGAPAGGQTVAAPPRATISATSAAVRSIIIPGLGQFSTGRAVPGVLFLAAAGGALAAGLLSESVTVYCRAPTTGECPEGSIADEVSESKLTLGLAGFAAVAVVAAIEAYSGANRINRSAQAPAAPESRSGFAVRIFEPSLHTTTAGVHLGLVRINF